jgi:non-histone chromosomal protein 6
MGHSQHTDKVFVSTSKDKAKKTAGKKKRDPNAPKRNQTAFAAFAKIERPILKTNTPTISFGDASKCMGEKWKKMTEEEKKPYNDQIADDKRRYEREMAAYKKTLSANKGKERKDMSLMELGYLAAREAIDDFIEEERVDMAMDSYDDDDEEVYDRVQPPGAGCLTFIPLPPRASAEKVHSLLSEYGNAKAKKSLEKLFPNDSQTYIKAYQEGYSGVIIPLSKSENKKLKEERGMAKKRGHGFIVSFDYHH